MNKSWPGNNGKGQDPGTALFNQGTASSAAELTPKMEDKVVWVMGWGVGRDQRNVVATVNHLKGAGLS